MKTLALVLALSLTPVAALAQAAPPPAAPAPPSADAGALEALNKAWLTAYKTHDGPALDRILADDFQALYSGGRILNKADVIKAATNPDRIVAEVAWDDLRILVFGDVAVVRARSRLSGKTAAEGPFSFRNDYADIYVRRAGAWRAVSAHVVPVTE